MTRMLIASGRKQKRETARNSPADTDVDPKEDWMSSQDDFDDVFQEPRAGRRLISINRSPLARKIITFNLLGLVILVAGVLYLNPFRDSLLFQRERGLVVEAELIADVSRPSWRRGRKLRALLAKPCLKPQRALLAMLRLNRRQSRHWKQILRTLRPLISRRPCRTCTCPLALKCSFLMTRKRF